MQTCIKNLDIENKFDFVIKGKFLKPFYKLHIIIENKNILKPNGKILITAFLLPSLKNRIKFVLIIIFPDNNPEHKYYFDKKRFYKLATKA
jgi:hypothetical protein